MNQDDRPYALTDEARHELELEQLADWMNRSDPTDSPRNDVEALLPFIEGDVAFTWTAKRVRALSCLLVAFHILSKAGFFADQESPGDLPF